MNPNVAIRAAHPHDFAAILALNAADVQHLSALTLASLERLILLASYFRVAELDGTVAGFAAVMSESAAYDSVNFLWFKARYKTFLYIDRIAVSSQTRRSGIGSALYRDVDAFARNAGKSWVTCEINIRPPNLASVAFHDRHGFAAVGAVDIDDGKKTVSMRAKDVRSVAR